MEGRGRKRGEDGRSSEGREEAIDERTMKKLQKKVERKGEKERRREKRKEMKRDGEERERKLKKNIGVGRQKRVRVVFGRREKGGGIRGVKSWMDREEGGE